MLKILMNTGRQKEGAGGYAQVLSAKLLAPGCSGQPDHRRFVHHSNHEPWSTGLQNARAVVDCQGPTPAGTAVVLLPHTTGISWPPDMSWGHVSAAI
jgi:hypothetical protein